MYADKMSMAHSLEARVPYLDREVVEYAQRLPANLKSAMVRENGCTASMRRFSAKSILKRKKRGFAVKVVDDWFNNCLNGKMDGILLDKSSQMYSLLKSEVVNHLFADHRSDKMITIRYCSAWLFLRNG